MDTKKKRRYKEQAVHDRMDLKLRPCGYKEELVQLAANKYGLRRVDTKKK